MYNIPFTGNLATEPKDDLKRNTDSGVTRLNFRIAVNEGERGTDKEKTHFLPFTAFDTLAENMAKSLKKGDRISVIARVGTYQREVQINGEDVNLTIPSFTAKQVGPDLTWATAEVQKNAKKTRNADSFQDDEDDSATEKPAAKKAPAKRAPAKPAVESDDDDF